MTPEDNLPEEVQARGAEGEEQSAATPDEREVHQVLAHRTELKGRSEFLTKWVGWQDATWEPIGNFFHRFNAEVIIYCKEHGMLPELVDQLAPVAIPK